MTNINDLFCTPDQGRRLKELVPELTYSMVWVRINKNSTFDHKPYFDGEWIEHTPKGTEIQPALTLQELRDIMKDCGMCEYVPMVQHSWYQKVANSTAPELAQWVIQRLEEQS